MDDGSQQTAALWHTLPPTQRLKLIKALGRMALRYIRRVPAVEETSDDERATSSKQPRSAAGEDRKPAP
jgi:hypothetical protein